MIQGGRGRGGGIDGFSRLTVYLSSSTNNLAATVHALFVVAVEKNGWPSRVRSGKGGENVDVAASMLRRRELNRGSILLGSLYIINALSDCGELSQFVSVGRFFDTLFYHMEENGILESTNITDLFCLHYIFFQELPVT